MNGIQASPQRLAGLGIQCFLADRSAIDNLDRRTAQPVRSLGVFNSPVLAPPGAAQCVGSCQGEVLLLVLVTRIQLGGVDPHWHRSFLIAALWLGRMHLGGRLEGANSSLQGPFG